MKLQDAILKSMPRILRWIGGGRDRRHERSQQERGYNGLFDRRRGKRSQHRWFEEFRSRR